MSSEEFMKNIRALCCTNSVTTTASLLRVLPGKKPRADLMRLSNWFRGLDATTQQHVLEVGEMCSDQALYNFFLICDGNLKLPDTDNIKLVRRSESGVAEEVGRDMALEYKSTRMEY
jgi:hypothetical protein